MELTRNPYAPSRATLNGGEVRDEARLWRLGKAVLIMSRDGDLPDRCVKCNEPADEPTKTRTVYWHHPGFYLFLLINVILYVIVALIARKRVKVTPALCARHKKKRVAGLWVGWGSFIVGFFAMSAAVGNERFDLALVLLLVMLSGIIAGIIMSRIVYANRINDRYVQLRGCGKAFLAELPEFRPGARDFGAL